MIDVVIPIGPNDLPSPQLVKSLCAMALVQNVYLVVCSEADYQACVTLADEKVRPLLSARGRAAQQNAGAKQSTAPWLWFIHADSRFADDCESAIGKAIYQHPQALCYLDLAFNDGGWRMRINAFGVWLRSRCLHLPFGDQALLLAREQFQALGGFDPALSSGEDHALVWRAKRKKMPIKPVYAKIYTSARKYQTHGWLKTTLHHLQLTLQQALRFSK